jgi:cytoskeletal protein CcmA (bactofilin family)
MFNAAKNQPAKTTKKPAPGRDANAVTILTTGCHFSGKLYCRGASRIGGKIDGQIVSEGLLIVEEEAVITAEIKADEAIIQGRIQGKLQATGRVELCASSQFDGDIITPVLVVREGAQFNGHATMVRKEETQGKAPRIVASNKQKDHGKQPDFDREQRDVAVLKVPEVHVPT